MKSKIKKELCRDTFDLTNLSISQKQKILNRFFSIHQQIFLSQDSEDERYRNEIIESHAKNITLEIYKTKQYRDVGFCILFRFKLNIEDKSITVFRSAAGLLPEYRHNLATLPGGLLYVLKHKLVHPWEEMYYYGIYVHPSSYHLLYKYYPLIYPSLKKQTPTATKKIIEFLKHYFDTRPAISQSELCGYTGWVTIDKDQKLMKKKKQQYPDVAYFHEKNPKFTEGDGLIVLIPVKIHFIFKSLFRLTFARFFSPPS